MNAEILSVGTELLMGQICNTNAQFISQRLNSIGINVYYHSVVGDNSARLKHLVDIALQRSDVIILTGGLGPTEDDLTKETVSEALQIPLVLHHQSLKKIEAFFHALGRPMSPNNIKQAYIPKDSMVLENSIGTAPGCLVDRSGKIIILLPGPPYELQPMFENSVLPYLQNKSTDKISSAFVKIFGIGESDVEQRIIDLIDSQSNPTIATYAKDAEVLIRVTASHGQNDSANDLLEPVISELKSRFGDSIYSFENKELDQVVAELLINKNIHIAIAESCTGGLISSRLINTPGISKVLDFSAVTYSNESKQKLLNVRAETLQKYGAVSSQTAIEMASGVKALNNSDIGLSITGIAGPTGATPEKPIGLVYIALASNSGTTCTQVNLHGDRERIRNMACLYALEMIRRLGVV